MDPLGKPPVAPCCSVSRRQLAERTRVESQERREQLRFERICARELMGEID